MRILVVLLFCSFLGFANAQSDVEGPVKWTFKVEKVSDEEYKLVYTADVEDGWAIYSQHIEEGGPIATSFTIEESDGVELVGDVIESDKKVVAYDDIFEMEVIKMKGQVDFFQMVQSSKKGAKVKGFLTFMCCDDTKCLPPSDVDFEFVVE